MALRVSDQFITSPGPKAPSKLPLYRRPRKNSQLGENILGVAHVFLELVPSCSPRSHTRLPRFCLPRPTSCQMMSCSFSMKCGRFRSPQPAPRYDRSESGVQDGFLTCLDDQARLRAVRLFQEAGGHCERHYCGMYTAASGTCPAPRFSAFGHSNRVRTYSVFLVLPSLLPLPPSPSLSPALISIQVWFGRERPTRAAACRALRIAGHSSCPGSTRLQ